MGVVQIFEDAERLLPGIPCFLRFVGGEVVVAEMGEDLGFAEAVADFTEDAESLLVAGSSLGEVAEAVFCVAEAVPPCPAW
jgi:hypothetical protein